MFESFKLVGLNYKTSPLEFREKVAFNESQAKEFMRQLSEILVLNDLLVVSTCNRTEIYYSSEDDKSAEIIKFLKIVKGLTDNEAVEGYFTAENNHDKAVKHLFGVAMGLEAQVVGDMQIINQVKNAYQWSADMNMAGPFLHRLLHAIFYTNKRVVQETAFRDGAASVSYATVDLLEEIVPNIQEQQVLVIGLGEIGEDVCRHLQNSKFKQVAVCNRTLSKADKIAVECGLTVIPFENKEEALLKADVIISCITADKPLINVDTFSSFELFSHKYIVDLGVPRSVATEVEKIPGIILYNIDEIQSKSNEVLEKRLASIPAVQQIVEESLNGLGDWSQEMLVSPTINKLKNALEQIRQEEMSRYVKKLTNEEAELIDKVTRGMMQKLMKLPVLQLKAACKRGEAETLIDVLNDLFDLEKQSDKVPQQ